MLLLFDGSNDDDAKSERAFWQPHDFNTMSHLRWAVLQAPRLHAAVHFHFAVDTDRLRLTSFPVFHRLHPASLGGDISWK